MPSVTEFWQINAGQVISIATFLLGAAAVWQKMKDKLEQLEERTKANSAELNELTKLGVMTTVQQHERRISQLESAVLDIREMRNDIRWLKRERGGAAGSAPEE